LKASKTLRLEDLEAELSLIPDALRDAADQALEAPTTLELARSFCPVNTGALRDSIRVERPGPLQARLVAGGGGYVNPLTGRDVDYARHVHDGTSRTPARPFMLQAVLATRAGVGQEILEKAAGVR
jgi:HK97 gp10 family phage protein